ncbi:hypothetical protein AM500_11625 [Bacillus sp. FJAT-18017]|uniref:hypothetical protein n=1 Tax=Bacillus sp. FJAT-18017 TaxID=1705566 RepID=UPI0006AEEA87|nr:hypothetical protein [Bacillus sp. FJAT-18017]ALC90362.1 hypothetical protein AM500_11625 [Bacillus sp. FJAT-18017]
MAAGKKLSLIGLAIALAGMAYLESPYSLLNRNYYVEKDTPPVRRASAVTSSIQVTEYEYRFVDKQNIGGYTIEMYEEYEVRKDSIGNIIESKPTGNFNEIKYKDYSYQSHP